MTYTSVQGTRKEITDTGTSLQLTRTENVILFIPELALDIDGEVNCTSASKFDTLNYIILEAGDDQTTYTITGTWQSRDVWEATLQDWQNTMTDDWWNIYALDAGGNRIATGIHDAVIGDGTVRTGVFDNVTPLEIFGIEIEVPYDGVTILDHHDVVWNPHSFATIYDYTITYDNKMLIVDMEFDQSDTDCGWAEFGYKVYVDETDNDENPMSSRWCHYDITLEYGGTNYWLTVVNCDPYVEFNDSAIPPIPLHTDFDRGPYYDPGLGYWEIKVKCYDTCPPPPIGVHAYGHVKFEITPLACHRISIDSVTLYNLMNTGTFVYGTRKEIIVD